MTRTATRIAVVGLGAQGAGIGALLLKQGYHLVGGVDIGARVGQSLASLVPGADSHIGVRASITELIARDKPRVVVLAAATSSTEVIAQATQLLSAGIDTLALHEDLLVPDSTWAEPLERIGRRTGASFLATGVQDTWWIHLPAVLAGGACDIHRVELIHHVDADGLPASVGHLLGLGLTPEELHSRMPYLLDSPSVMSGPLLETARAMGSTPLKSATIGKPLTAQEDIVWSSNAGSTITAGRVIGLVQTTTVETREQVVFEGTLTTALVPGGTRAPDQVIIHGTPDIRVALDHFKGAQITNTSVINRIPDVIAAPGGVLSARTLPPIKHCGRVSR